MSRCATRLTKVVLSFWRPILIAEESALLISSLLLVLILFNLFVQLRHKLPPIVASDLQRKQESEASNSAAVTGFLVLIAILRTVSVRRKFYSQSLLTNQSHPLLKSNLKVK